jgi:hypothetical protein
MRLQTVVGACVFALLIALGAWVALRYIPHSL